MIYSFDSSFIPDYFVYTDGACSNNGKSNSSSGIGIYFGDNDNRNVSKKLSGIQTNNTAELTAIIETYFIIKNDILNNKNIVIVTDSKYSLLCLSSYGLKCHKNNWIKNIPNKSLVKQIFDLYHNLSNVKFMHILAHTNNNNIHSIGNSKADELATNAIHKN